MLLQHACDLDLILKKKMLVCCFFQKSGQSPAVHLFLTPTGLGLCNTTTTKSREGNDIQGSLTRSELIKAGEVAC